MNENIQAKRIIPWIIATALFMETLDVTIISTAIPTMAASFRVDLINLKLALTSYLFSLAVFISVSGWVSDKWGTQRTFLFALAIFTLSSIGCGKATSLSALVSARVVQGIGGAFMMPVGRLIMLRVFHKSELLRAMNFMTFPALLGPLLGPFVGGAITTYYSWPWIFYVNVPVGILGILATIRYIKNENVKLLRPFDFLGFLLFGASLAGLFFVFETINEPSISIHAIVFVGLCTMLGFLAFYWHYQKKSHPVLNLKLFSIRTFLIAALGNLWIRLGMSSVSFLLPLLFQIGYGLSPLRSGLLMCVWTLGMMSVKFINKRILQRLGFRTMLLFTSICTGVTIGSFFLIQDINVPLIVGLVFINGVVSSLQFFAMNILYYVDIVPAEMSNATSISSTLQQLSMGFGIALSALVLQMFIGWNHPLVLYDPSPLRLTFLLMGSISILSLFIFLKLKTGDGQEMT